jgi:WD40 repeat protein
VASVAFSPEGARLVSGSVDKTVKVWDVELGQEVLTLRGHTGLVTRVVLSPDGTLLASACLDGIIRIWDGSSRTAAPP